MPVWSRNGEVDDDRFRQSRAQDRFARRVREAMAAAELSESDLESRLGYKPRSLIRKLKGYELMTLRDVLRIGSEFGPSVLVSLVDGDASDVIVAERDVPRSAVSQDDVRNLLYDAAHQLDAASRAARDNGDTRAEAFTKLAEVIAALAEA